MRPYIKLFKLLLVQAKRAEPHLIFEHRKKAVRPYEQIREGIIDASGRPLESKIETLGKLDHAGPPIARAIGRKKQRSANCATPNSLGQFARMANR
jgi:hypothetical protein